MYVFQARIKDFGGVGAKPGGLILKNLWKT